MEPAVDAKRCFAAVVLAMLCVSHIAIVSAERDTVTAETGTREKARTFDKLQMEEAIRRRAEAKGPGWGLVGGLGAGLLAGGILGAKLANGMKRPSSEQALKQQLAKLQADRANAYYNAQVQGLVSRVSADDTKCVICQFIVQRVRAEMLLNGIGGSVPFGVNSESLTQMEGKMEKKSEKLDSAAPPAGLESAAAAGAASSGSEGFIETMASTSASTDSRDGGIFDTLTGALTGQNKKVMNKEAAIMQRQLAQLGNPPYYQANPSIPPFNPHPLPPVVQRTTQAWRSKRERNEDLQVYKPSQSRYSTMYDGPYRAELRAQERFENNQMYAIVYQVVDEICSKRMPKPFFAYCGEMMRQFQSVAEGLRWRDRPDAVCMQLNSCGPTSYVQQGPHSTYKDYY